MQRNATSRHWQFGLLPHELCFKILSYTPHHVQNARQVCKHWRTMAEKAVTGFRVLGDFGVPKNALKRIHALVSRNRHVININFRNLALISDQDVRLVFVRGRAGLADAFWRLARSFLCWQRQLTKRLKTGISKR